MLIDFGPGSRRLFTATVNQKVTYGLATIRQEPKVGFILTPYPRPCDVHNSGWCRGLLPAQCKDQSR
jgi:hypothetical protein